MADQDVSLFSHFRRQIAAHGEKALLATADGRLWSYAEVDRRSAQMASLFRILGIGPGERISVQVQKSPENLCLYLACLRGGYVFHPLNMAYKRAELEYFIGNAAPAVIVCDSGNEDMLGGIAPAGGVQHLLTLDADGRGSLTDGAASQSERFETVPRAADDLAALLYSSGTTGRPKGIMLTHRNLLSNTEALVQAWGFNADDMLLHALPIFHVHGLFVAIGCVLLSGAGMRWLPAFDARRVASFLPECTVMMGVPTYYTRLLAEPSFTAESCRRMRLFVSGSAPLLEETFAGFEVRTGHRILERYGMTETNMNTSNPLEGERRPGTVGPPLPGVDVRVVDDAGRILPAGEIGNLQVRGPNVFIGYWRMPEKTAEDFTGDGFFNTGDMARTDEDGYVSIVGRAKDVVITGGLNVYPKEIELFIDDLPGVRESAVIGVPHADFGEGVVAVVVPADGGELDEAGIVRACRAELADFKVPKRVVFADELPRNSMAKVQKNALRERYGNLFVGEH
ncbi:MAG: malonyl-CoA synthase [Woeseia sp.]